MTTTTSFSNNRFMSMFKASLLRTRSFTAFYTILAFVFFPLQYILSMVSEDNIAFSYNTFVGGSMLYGWVSAIFFVGIMIIMPLFLGAQLFGDMHNKKSVDLYHSLPVKRSTALLAKMAAGMVSMSFVLIVNYVIAMIAQKVHFMGIAKFLAQYPQSQADTTDFMYIRMTQMLNTNTALYALKDIVCWLAVLFTLLAIMAFICVQVGTIFDTVVLTLGTYGVLPVIYIVFLGLFEKFIYGYCINVNWSFVSNLTPISSLVQTLFMSDMAMTSIYDEMGVNYYRTALLAVGIWFVVGIALTFFATKIYEKRKSEQAESTDTNGIVKIFLKLAGTFVVAIAVGLMFEALFNGITYMYIGIFIGATLCYIIMDIIFARSFKRVIKSMPGGIISSVAIAIFIVVLSNGGFGYVTSIPTLDSIQSVSIQYRGPYGTYNERRNDNYGYSYVNDVTLESREAIEIVQNMHKTQVTLHKNKQYEKEVKYNYRGSSSLDVTYTLKNGKTVSRSYRELYNDTEKIYTQIDVNEEFVKKTHPAFRTTYDMTKGEIIIYDVIGVGAEVRLNREQFDGLMTAMTNDLLSRTYEDLTNPQALPLGFIEIRYIERDMEYTIEDMGPQGTFVVDNKNARFTDGYFIIDRNSAYTINYLEKLGYSTASLEPDWSEVGGLHVTQYAYGKGAIGSIYQTNIDNKATYDDTNFEYYRRMAEEQMASEDNILRSEIFLENGKYDMAGIMKNARATARTFADEYVYIQIIHSGRMTGIDENSYTADMSYVIKRSDLPEAINKMMPPNDPYYLDRYGNRDYNRTYAYEASAIGVIGGADGPTNIIVTDTTTTKALMKLKPEAEVVVETVSK